LQLTPVLHCRLAPPEPLAVFGAALSQRMASPFFRFIPPPGVAASLRSSDPRDIATVPPTFRVSPSLVRRVKQCSQLGVPSDGYLEFPIKTRLGEVLPAPGYSNVPSFPHLKQSHGVWLLTSGIPFVPLHFSPLVVIYHSRQHSPSASFPPLLSIGEVNLPMASNTRRRPFCRFSDEFFPFPSLLQSPADLLSQGNHSGWGRHCGEVGSRRLCKHFLISSSSATPGVAAA